MVEHWAEMFQPREQNSNVQQVNFDNANDDNRHKNTTTSILSTAIAKPSKEANDNESRCSYTDKNDQHHDGNSASDANSSDVKTDACGNAYEHGYNAGVDTSAAYATRYSEGHADGQDTMIVLGDESDCNWGSNEGSYDNNNW